MVSTAKTQSCWRPAIHQAVWQSRISASQDSARRGCQGVSRTSPTQLLPKLGSSRYSREEQFQDKPKASWTMIYVPLPQMISKQYADPYASHHNTFFIACHSGAPSRWHVGFFLFACSTIDVQAQALDIHGKVVSLGYKWRSCIHMLGTKWVTHNKWHCHNPALFDTW